MSSRISYDILSEILVHLPVKTLVRFLALSKSWLDLVHTPDVMGRLPVTTAGFLYRAKNGSPRPSHHYVSVDGNRYVNPSDSIASHLMVAASANGLLLLRHGLNGALHFEVRNPALRTASPIPASDHMTRHSHVAAGILFDPRTSPHYEIVEVKQRTSSLRLEFQVYSSDGAEWKKLGDFHQSRALHRRVHAGDVVCTERSFYVLLRDENDLANDHAIVAVHLGEGSKPQVEVMRLPPQFGATHLGLEWFVSRLSLCVDQRGCVRLFSAREEGLCAWDRVKGAGSTDEEPDALELRQCWHFLGRTAFKGNEMIPMVVGVEGDTVFVWIGKRIVAFEMQAGRWKEFAIDGIGGWERGSARTWPVIPYSPMIPYSPCLVNPFGAKMSLTRTRKRAGRPLPPARPGRARDHEGFFVVAD